MKNKALIVAKHEFIKTVKRKSFLFTALLLPMLVMVPLLLAMHYLPSMVPDTLNEKIGFVDYSGFLEQNQKFIEYEEIDVAKQALINEDVSLFFVVEKDYFNTSKITIYSKNTGSFFSSTPTRAVKDFLVENLIRFGNVNDDIARKIANPMLAESVTLDKDGNFKKEKDVAGGFLLPYSLAVLLILSILTSSGYLLQGIAEEKESRSGELLLSSISADQLLKGKILGYGSVGLVQISIWITLAVIKISSSPLAGLFAGIEISWVFGLAIIYFILGYFLFATSIACAAAVSSTAKEAQQTSMIFTMFAVIPMMFAQFIIQAPNSNIAKILTYFPYTSPFITMMRLPLVEISFYEIALSIGILIIAIVIIAKLSGKIFRMGMLMYGKRASVKDIVIFLKEK